MARTSGGLNELETYDPDRMLDEVLHRMRLKSDASLGRLVEISPPSISKVRQRHLPVGAIMLIRLHEVSGISIAELRALMGDSRPKFS